MTIEIMNTSKPTAADFAERPWGATFLRELDLVVAANEFASTVDRHFFTSNDQMGLRAAERCLPLDKDAQVAYMGVVAMSAFTSSRDPAWQQAATALASMPRGHWQIWSDGQGFDIWAATGQGRITTPSGQKFVLRHSGAAGLDGLVAYATVLSKIVYDARNRIRDEITEATTQTATITPGERWKNRELEGVEWSNIEYVGRENLKSQAGLGWKFMVSKRGKKAGYVLTPNGIIRFLGLAPVLPEKYHVDDGVDRTTSMRERRQAAAQAAYDGMTSALPKESRRGSKAAFYIRTDTLERDVFDGEHPVGSVVVQFAPASDAVIGASYHAGRLVQRNAAPVSHPVAA